MLEDVNGKMNSRLKASSATVVAPITNRSYLVKWKGYPESDNSWVPRSNLHPVTIEEYEKKVGVYV